ncbi:hypothetical protein WICANDRAFT_17706, partial [Wickerhamomyces anomalus NRRL Y-366-8]
MINKITKIPVSKLSSEEIQKQLLNLSNWKYSNNEISKEYKLGNFEETWAFLNQISLRSHLWGHHPTITTTYNQVKITLTTHDVQGVSDIDIKFAKRIEGY